MIDRTPKAPPAEQDFWSQIKPLQCWGLWRLFAFARVRDNFIDLEEAQAVRRTFVAAGAGVAIIVPVTG